MALTLMYLIEAHRVALAAYSGLDHADPRALARMVLRAPRTARQIEPPAERRMRLLAELVLCEFDALLSLNDNNIAVDHVDVGWDSIQGRYFRAHAAYAQAAQAQAAQAQAQAAQAAQAQAAQAAQAQAARGDFAELCAQDRVERLSD